MLRSLRVSNYILIGSLETSFPEGLSIISGETGAGKSILLGALTLVLGGKGDASMIGPAGDNCVVEAEFGVTPQVEAFLRENDLPKEPDGIVLRRVVSKSGRSRSFLCDEPVAAATLQELAGLLVDIHSQHQTLRLQDRMFRLEALDLYAAASAEREKCAGLWSALQEADRRLRDIREAKERARKEEDYNRALLQKLQEAALQSGELPELEEEQKRLAHAEELMETLSEAGGILSSEEYSPAMQLRQVQRLLEKAGKFIGPMEDLARRLEAVRVETEDIEADVQAQLSRLDVSPARLEQVDARLSLLYSLMQKHGVQTEEELIARREELEVAVAYTDSLEEEEESAVLHLEQLQEQYRKCAGKLHELREKASASFGASIQKQLRALDLDNAVFRVALSPSAAGPTGEDAVDFLFSSTGKEPGDVARNASGGELSRIMLSLKACMATFRKMPTLVFDEIDTGVSGSTADKMGSLVCSMGSKMQVIAITHLPQVAAKGHAHFLVSRKADVTSMRLLDSQERVMEIARMLSGASITPAAIENAKSLLG
ncbi:MAG: DNA repair protein RecN [Bacteroidales bacterium]|nr:DNA repair protein RecN [Bacteroidales bacterium]